MLKKVSFLLAAVFCIFHTWTALFGVLPGIGQKAVHLGLILVIFFMDSLNKEGRKWYWKLIDILFLLMAVGSTVYVIQIDSTLDLRSGIIYTYDILFGVMLIVVLLEASRRAVGLSLTIVSLVFLAFAFAGPYLPSFLAHPGFSLASLTNIIYLTTDGIYGSAIYASASYIVLFVILGSVFNETGVGDFFTKLSSRLFGRFRGGPAKIAVVASGLFGSISGSAIANVIGTGTFTIPLMKKSGFETEYAAAVEASASTGGQIMPPVMGATAFLIAEYLGVPYFELVAAAFIPAVLFFGAILMTIDLYARKHDIKGIDKEDLPSGKELIKKSYLLLPLIYLVLSMSVFKMTVTKAGITSIIVTIICTLISAETRLNKEKLIRIVKGSVAGAKPVAIACGVVGIIIGVVMGSGLGFRMSSLLIEVSQGNLIILLFLTMLVSLILGMGVPTTAAYLMLALLVVPALKKMGVVPMAAHLFIFYFGIISNITPPVALASYAAAGIARCNPNKTGFYAFKLALSGFILPFMFVFNPVLLMQGSAGEIILAFLTALTGIYCLAASLEQYVFRFGMTKIESVILFIIAILLIIPGIITDVAGIVVLAGIYIWKSKGNKNALSPTDL